MYFLLVNCVLMRNFNEDEICDFVEFTKTRKVDVRFIEYMPFSGNKWQTDRLISFKYEKLSKEYSFILKYLYFQRNFGYNS